jgi:GTP-binding protein
VLLLLVDGTEDNIIISSMTIRRELEEYGDRLSSKSEIVALNKIDALTSELIKEKQLALSEVSRQDVVTISGISGMGIKHALRDVFRSVTEFRSIKEAAEQLDKPNETINTKVLDQDEADYE